MLLQASLPDAYWGEATATACYIQNRIPSTRNPTTMPYTLWHGHPPHLGHLRIFGSIAYPLVTQPLSKLSPRAQRTIFGGYGDRFGIKAYRLYIQDHHKFIFARTVVFDEEIILSDINKFEPHNSTSTTSPPQHTSTLHLDQAVSSSHGHTRSLREIYEATSFSAVLTNDTILEHPQESLEDALPLSVHDALASSESKEWHAAILDELQALEAANTWELVPPPEHHNIVSCKWLLKKKYHSNGSVDRHKARLVPRGFTQQEGVDYFDIYSPVLGMTAFRVLIALAAKFNLLLHHLDIKTAFLHGFLQELIYMLQPPHFEDPHHPDYVCKLNKPIYGLKQSVREWYIHMHQYLIKCGWEHFMADYNIYIW
ncbi:hypothetical protein L7F22_060274 [Adiantum nelumboides]|nr:hypothetical protein [Adiantum nelumboides]